MKHLSPSEIKPLIVETPVPTLTPEQADILRRLEAYPHEYFDLRRTGTFTVNKDECFVCVAGALGYWRDEANKLRDMCGPYDSEAGQLMHNLVSAPYGRDVPGVRDYPETAVPKSVAIKAVRDIFEMANWGE